MKGQNFVKGTLQSSWKELWDSQGLNWLLGDYQEGPALSVFEYAKWISWLCYLHSQYIFLYCESEKVESEKVRGPQKCIHQNRSKSFQISKLLSAATFTMLQVTITATVFLIFWPTVARTNGWIHLTAIDTQSSWN